MFNLEERMEPANGVTGYTWGENLKLQLSFLAGGVGPSHLELYVNYLLVGESTCETLGHMKQDLNKVSLLFL